MPLINHLCWFKVSFLAPKLYNPTLGPNPWGFSLDYIHIPQTHTQCSKIQILFISIHRPRIPWKGPL
jgi:hypothetical protein